MLEMTIFGGGQQDKGAVFIEYDKGLILIGQNSVLSQKAILRATKEELLAIADAIQSFYAPVKDGTQKENPWHELFAAAKESVVLVDFLGSDNLKRLKKAIQALEEKS